MRKNAEMQEKPQNLKRKLMSALAMLLVATTLMTTTSYAWFVLSTAPEVTGIETQVGSNGSLEIALLNTETRTDMSLIRSGLGDSIVAGNLAANYAWGNLVDLGYQDYGLGEILLLPTRLNYTGNADEGYSVDPSGLLAIPTYGYDGRVVDLTDDTVSAIFQNNEFAFVTGVQEYGVRAIGTSNALSVQGSSLANAKGNIPTYTKSARTNAQAVLASHGDPVFNIMLNHLSDDAEPYTDVDRDALKSLLAGLEKSASDIDASLRQGLVAYAASEIAEEDTFVTVKDKIMSAPELKGLMEDLSEVGTVPAEFTTWVNALDKIQNDLNAAMNACNALEGNDYTWDQIRGVLNYVMNVDAVYIGEDLFANVNPDAIIDAVMDGQEITMTLAPGSGVFADISVFAGNYSSSMTVMGVANILITTSTAGDPYLTTLAVAVDKLEPAEGGVEAVSLPLTATYGYALDLAFRCNAAEPDLVLQTNPEQRVYEQSEAASTQGGGSYMEFTSSDDSLTLEQRLKLMDAVRVGFVDDQGKLLGVAKLNISNRLVENGLINAPLYLYEYSFSEEDGSMIMGERKLEDNLITAEMQQNVAKAITVVVWLDGDLVDNTMVSATEAASLSGVLNLQFATSAELIPATDGTLLDYTPDASGLEALIAEYADEFTAGQGNYTNVSWNAFVAAYNRAVAVNENENPSGVEITNATANLYDAATALTPVSLDAINEKVAQLRENMGTVSGDTAGYIIKNADGSYSVVGAEEHTQEEHDSWEVVGQVDRVDYNKNLNDEGNDLYTPIYSDASWNALASALYQAEAIAKNENATEDQINAAMTAIENAEKALSRQVFFKPYEYRGALYYEAICDAANADTYGKWYDNTFKRIVSDLTILNLDAYAQEVDIVTLGQGVYVSSDAGYITPDIAFLAEVFPELRGVEVKGVNWNEVDENLFAELMNQNHYSKLSELVTMADTDPVLNHAMSTECRTARDAANDLMTKWTDPANTTDITADEAETAIQTLNDAIVKLYDENLKKMDEESTTMTDTQRILLTAAVNSAKAVTGYDDPASIEDAAQKTKVETLKEKTEAAESLLAGDATREEAETALTELNATLKTAGGREVTEYNTLTHKLPEGFDAEDIVYSVDFPGIHLKLTGTSGKTTIGAQVLTKDGVVVSVSKEITVYDRADGVKLTQLGNAIDSLSLNVNQTADITAELLYELGGENTGDKPLNEIVKEEVKNFKWASAITDIATVAGKESGTATITPVAAGITTVSVSIETKAGNFYTMEIPVTVSE